MHPKRWNPVKQASIPLILGLYLLIFITEGPPNLHTGVLVGVMDDDVVPIPSDVHCTEEVRAMKK